MQLLAPAVIRRSPRLRRGRSRSPVGQCALEVDLSRLGTLAGKPRFLPERDRAGTTVGGYRIEARIGSGGMGHVYRAWRQTAVGSEEVAVKFLAAGLAGDGNLRARFLREVQVLQGLSHPAIVRVQASGEADGVPWFAMTLVAGPSLRARLAERPLAAAEAQVVFARVLAALDHAHAHGVIHRDLKPGNVLLGPEGAVLADFGIALPIEASAGLTHLTETAALLGTLPYMSPEQRAGAPLDHRSDLFSVGVMLYEALTGLLPQGAFAPPSRLRSGLPTRLRSRRASGCCSPTPTTAIPARPTAPGRWPARWAPPRAGAPSPRSPPPPPRWRCPPRRAGRPCSRSRDRPGREGPLPHRKACSCPRRSGYRRGRHAARGPHRPRGPGNPGQARRGDQGEARSCRSGRPIRSGRRPPAGKAALQKRYPTLKPPQGKTPASDTSGVKPAR